MGRKAGPHSMGGGLRKKGKGGRNESSSARQAANEQLILPHFSRDIKRAKREKTKNATRGQGKGRQKQWNVHFLDTL